MKFTAHELALVIECIRTKRDKLQMDKKLEHELDKELFKLGQKFLRVK